jgi:hypothetical protein
MAIGPDYRKMPKRQKTINYVPRVTRNDRWRNYFGPTATGRFFRRRMPFVHRHPQSGKHWTSNDSGPSSAQLDVGPPATHTFH